MNKVVLLAGVACLCATNVFAADFNPYVSAKLKYVYGQHKETVKGSFGGFFIDDYFVAEESFKITEHNKKGVFGGALAVGVSSPLEYGSVRMELEYAQNADAKEGRAYNEITIETKAAFVNAYYDFDLKSSIPLTPYIGMGLGWGHLELKYNSEAPSSFKKDGLAFNIGAGVSYAISENIAFDAGYRFVRYAPIKKTLVEASDGSLKIRVESRAHEFVAGIRYTF